VTFDLILIGYGNVARRFVSLLDEQRATLARQYGTSTRIIGIATRRHGQVFSQRGVDAERALFPPSPGRGFGGTSKPDPAHGTRDTLAFLRDAIDKSRVAARQRRLVVVETTTLDVDRGEPAASYIRAALAGGAHVITANKGPVACAYRALRRAAERADRRWLFEGAVMDGVPIFNLARETMPAVKILGFRGVVNSTTNFMLTAMENGEDYGAALERMQAAGVAEADPSLDVDGWDAAAKAAVLANILLDANTTPLSVAREGIGPATGARAIEARTRGRRVKLVATGSGRGATAQLRVGLEELAADDPLAILEGQANALELDTWPLGRIVITQRDGGLEKTAYALLADLVTVARRVAGR
jgi:homoserine dehydrogenase